jgi:hypothetical protein
MWMLQQARRRKQMTNQSRIVLSDSARQSGVAYPYRSVPTVYQNSSLVSYFKQQVYDGATIVGLFQWPLIFGAVALIAQLPFAIRKDIRRRKEMKYGRRLKGPVFVTPKQFNKAIQGTGGGLNVNHCREMLRVPLRAEDQHFEIIGDTGSGKTTTIMQDFPENDRTECGRVGKPRHLQGGDRAMKATHFDGSRDGRNFSLDRQTEPLVLDSEISGLENLNAYLKHGNYVTRFSFPLLEVPATKPKFIERLEDDCIVREPRKEQKDQPEAAKNEARSNSPTHAESKPTSDEQNRKSPVTKPASEAQKERPANSNLDPRI